MEKFDDPAGYPSLIAKHRDNLARLGSAQQMSKVERAFSPPESRTSRLLRVVRRSIKYWLGGGEPDHRPSAKTVPTSARQHNDYSGSNRDTDWAGSSRDSSMFSEPSLEKGVTKLYKRNQQISRGTKVDPNFITNVIEARHQIGIRRLQDNDLKSTDKTSPEKAAQFKTRSILPMSTPSRRDGLSVELPPSYEASQLAKATGENAPSRTVQLLPTVPNSGTNARKELMDKEPRSYSR